MKKCLLLWLTLMPMWCAMAFDFSAIAPSGQTLYYRIVEGGVELTYPNVTSSGSQAWMGYERPAGQVEIPAVVSDGNSTYPIVAIGHHAFYYCDLITSVSVPAGVSLIDTSAFNRCTALQSVSLPATIDTIKDMVFSFCYGLQTFTMRRSAPPTTAANCFYATTLDSCVLNVGCGGTSLFAEAAPWSTFGSISDEGCQVEILATANYADRGVVTGGGLYDVGTVVMLHAAPAEGFFFAAWNDGDTSNPRFVSLEDNCHFVALFFASHHDTITLYDTLWLRDTVVEVVYPTFYQLSVLSDNPDWGIGVGSALLPAGSRVEVCALPIEGHRFVTWEDGSEDNPRQLTLTTETTLKALFSRTDLSEPQPEWALRVDGLTVEVRVANDDVVGVFDLSGHQLFSRRTSQGQLKLRLPTAGVYLVQYGSAPAQKVVVGY